MKRTQKGFTLVELMIVVVILGILAAIAIPAFIKYIRQSKTSEAKENLGYIYKGMVTYYQEEHNVGGTIFTLYFPPASGALPVAVPKGTRVTVPATSWEGDVTWDAIRFTVSEPLYYQYQITPVTVGPGNGAAFSAQAVGDLDGDAITSLFQRAANVDATGEPVGAPLIETKPTE